jgi:hypothetical protein
MDQVRAIRMLREEWDAIAYEVRSIGQIKPTGLIQDTSKKEMDSPEKSDSQLIDLKASKPKPFEITKEKCLTEIHKMRDDVKDKTGHLVDDEACDKLARELTKNWGAAFYEDDSIGHVIPTDVIREAFEKRMDLPAIIRETLIDTDTKLDDSMKFQKMDEGSKEKVTQFQEFSKLSVAKIDDRKKEARENHGQKGAWSKLANPICVGSGATMGGIAGGVTGGPLAAAIGAGVGALIGWLASGYLSTWLADIIELFLAKLDEILIDFKSETKSLMIKAKFHAA